MALTGQALQQLLDHVKRADEKFFSTATDNANRAAVTSYLHERISIANSGYSSGTVQKSLHFVVNLGAHQPQHTSEFNIWVNDAKEDDHAANKAAVVRALGILIKDQAWARRKMVSVPAEG